MDRNRYPRWVYILIAVVLLGASLFALPNLYGEADAVQVSRERGVEMPADTDARVREILDSEEVPFDDVYWDGNRVLASFADKSAQAAGMEAIRDSFDALVGTDYLVALSFAPRSPDWLRALNLRPVHQGLDLRGGVYLLFEVDMPSALDQARESYVSDFKLLARDNDVPGIRATLSGETIRVTSRDGADNRDRMAELIRDSNNQFLISSETNSEGAATLAVRMSEQQIAERQDFAIEQNETTMRSRLNQLGVAEPIVQRQGADRIAVQLPGVQDPREIINTLRIVATLEFRGECDTGNPQEAKRTGRSPLGCELFVHRDGRDVLLKRDIIATGNQLTNATYNPSSRDGPVVNVNLDATAAKRMLRFTKANLQKRMAVVFIVTNAETDKDTGERQITTTEDVISLATIQGVFSNRFQISGLQQYEAQELAVLLRAGALAAPIFIVEERSVGPSLGKDNIERGQKAIVMGFFLVVVFMLVYYKVFGVFANFALFGNVVIILGVLSLLQASLTLPGIAGIVLTIGMAVDANVLIFERIREELRNGNSPQAAIHAGYDKAFSSIADANVTTLIAALVLWLFGTGPIRGFAITLSIGIASSMFTAIVGTRALANLFYGGRRIDKLAI